MRRLEPFRFRAFLLPVVVLALVVPVIAAFAFAGPGAGLATGALAATALIVLAARLRFDEPIEVRGAGDGRKRTLVLLTEAIEAPETVAAVAETAGSGTPGDGGEDPELLVVAPATERALARWTSDLGAARFEAQRRLAVSLASLAGGGVAATGQVGDADPVQALEDALREFAASDVLVVSGEGGEAVLSEIRRRLDRPVKPIAA